MENILFNWERVPKNNSDLSGSASDLGETYSLKSGGVVCFWVVGRGGFPYCFLCRRLAVNVPKT